MNPLAGSRFYVNPDSAAARQAREWQYSNPAGASQMRYLAAQPTAMWLGEWNANVGEDVRALVEKAQAAGSVPTFIAYAIPQRDCGGYSSGGTNNPSAYKQWIGEVAAGIGHGSAVVILEPDSLAQITCLSSNDQAARLALLSDAVSVLKKNSGTKVYIDAGHSLWIDAGTMANRLSRAGIAAADGFALNVSNFVRTDDEIAYGTAVSDKTGGKHFVIDTARNGNGSNGEWCNPAGRAVGNRPTTNTGRARVDAFLWLKVPGESDGTCNGGPSAGTWWPSYAVGLMQNAGIAGL
ncbi:glycoside hydrolase family 6 protein [Candidatus Kaiserbacteria bacterium]|nr:glycoside hydrolase family 6 protein [Candidatus Kaiserbacteria bacterium]